MKKELSDIKIKVGILLFNEVEVLDFAGPFEVFSLALRDDEKLCEVVTISENGEVITARNGLQVLPAKMFDDNFKFDILIVPGGYGAEEIEIKNQNLLNWIKQQHSQVNILASICTGAFLLAECGLLNNKRATTHWLDLEKFKMSYPSVIVQSNEKFIDEGDIITSGGISAGINMSLYILSKIFGNDVANRTAKRMEYDFKIEDGKS